MESISIFDILKIGVGPSSSHTLGPWKAALHFIDELREKNLFEDVRKVNVILYGSLALTGKGHGTDLAVLMGLSGADPETVPLEHIKSVPDQIISSQSILIGGQSEIEFDREVDIIFKKQERLPYHSNGIKFIAFGEFEDLHSSTYFSVGGGFIVHESETVESQAEANLVVPNPCMNAAELLAHCNGRYISDVVLENERVWRSDAQIEERLDQLWEVMKASVYSGCHTEGKLPGGLDVSRRASKISQKLLVKNDIDDVDKWADRIRTHFYDFSDIIKLIGCFSMAVNEENASFGRIVTAPTNGSAGVIPAVLFYLICFGKKETTREEIHRFLLTAGQIGILFKIGSTLSAAMGGCQAEIGVSSAMAAGALTEALGGTPQQVLMAAEIAMEHHLGLTC
ncbi:MAG: L-serine ammonia-lyase, partial [Cyclobacteriaceae bacterium]